MRALVSPNGHLILQIYHINNDNMMLTDDGVHSRVFQLNFEPVSADVFTLDNQDKGVLISSKWATIMHWPNYIVPLSQYEWQTDVVKPETFGDDYFKIAFNHSEYNISWFSKVNKAGTYEVFVRYPYGLDNNSQAKYRFRTALFNRQVTVNQQQNTGQWVSLGQYYIQVNGGFTVELSNEGNGETVADAVRLVQQL